MFHSIWAEQRLGRHPRLTFNKPQSSIVCSLVFIFEGSDQIQVPLYIFIYLFGLVSSWQMKSMHK